ncbi:ISL3 family transposase [Idiomarina sp.]|uniref:ISL3 family transposase n=1 Tax=Idiomarina sp. TaxID=1874361 RepID=UPI002584B617|nr:ISL3 family transposase [Idiomarina sp.]
MQEQVLFAAALGLQLPWYVSNLNFSLKNKKLDIEIDFERGSEFPCSCCGELSKAYDTNKQSWRHMDFFQHQAHLHGRVPRVNCPHGCGIKQIDVPWARSGSGFTLLFEGLILTYCKEIPVYKVGELMGEHDTRLWRVLHHYVDAARALEDYSQVTEIGMDETASRRGHTYVSFFYDLDKKKLLFGTSGKDKATVKAFQADFIAHGGNPAEVTQACSDMSPAFISGIEEYLPNADITFDKFHIVKIINEGVDAARREEVGDNAVLKNTRYLWLKNEINLTDKQKSTIENVSKLNLKITRAYQIRLNFQELFSQPDRASGEAFLNKWYFWATHSRLEPMIKAARTIKAHWDGVLNWFDSHLTTGFIEGMNGLIQAAKSRARGYRSDRNFIAIAYLLGAKLEFNLPT